MAGSRAQEWCGWLIWLSILMQLDEALGSFCQLKEECLQWMVSKHFPHFHEKNIYYMEHNSKEKHIYQYFRPYCKVFGFNHEQKSPANDLCVALRALTNDHHHVLYKFHDVPLLGSWPYELSGLRELHLQIPDVSHLESPELWWTIGSLLS